MKKHVISAAALLAFAAPVFAQSSVTLYGVIDEGFNYTSNVNVNGVGKSNYQLASGFVQGSRWGLRGSEDLGGGLKAIFTLENGFDVNNGRLGQGGRMFGRQAFVGLSHAQYGSLTLGRQYDSLVDYLAPLTANGNWGGTLFSHPFDNDNTDNSFRVNNTVKYASPDWNGLQVGGTYSFSNATGFSNNRQYSIGAAYTLGGLQLAAAYLQANNPGKTAGGAIADNDANFTADRLRIFGGGVNYTFGPATVGFVYTKTDVKNPVSTVYLPTATFAGLGLSATKFQNFEINGKYQLTPALFIGAQYVYTDGKFDAAAGSVKPKYHTVGLMADYNLSKRTDVYLQGAYQKVAGDKTGTIADGGYVVGTDGPRRRRTSSRFARRSVTSSDRGRRPHRRRRAIGRAAARFVAASRSAGSASGQPDRDDSFSAAGSGGAFGAANWNGGARVAVRLRGSVGRCPLGLASRFGRSIRFARRMSSCAIARVAVSSSAFTG
ncbi:hypothetical protein NCM_01679 [Burkholderia pseudomallei]